MRESLIEGEREEARLRVSSKKQGDGGTAVSKIPNSKRRAGELDEEEKLEQEQAVEMREYKYWRSQRQQEHMSLRDERDKRRFN